MQNQTFSRRVVLRAALSGVTLGFPLCAGQSAWAADEITPAQQAAPVQLTDQQKIVHVLNRLGFGPRPGDVERVQKMGLEAYIQQQLHPETIDDSAVDKALDPLDTLNMDPTTLMTDYWIGVKQFIMRQKAEGNNEDMKLRYGIDYSGSKATTQPGAEGHAVVTSSKMAGGGMAGGGMTGGKAGFDMSAPERDGLRCVGELQQAKIIRAVVSERQMQEVLVDFWGNHFNIDVKKALCRPLKGQDDREVIRAHVFGKFRDLLEASAKSPAMIHYLDNQQNSVTRERSEMEKKAIARFLGQRLANDGKGLVSDKEGPNENYGREIMELHTLGVDGGYTQKDVQEVARCFSGWSMNAINGTFMFQAHRHDDGEKDVLGHVIPAGGGIKDGEMVLDILANHPSTAHFISKELCQRFVCDQPPTDLVERTAKVFTETEGDLRKVVESIVTSPEFFSATAYRAKVKSPFEFAVSAVRAGAGEFVTQEPTTARIRSIREGAGTIGYGGEQLTDAKRKSLNWSIYDMGQPLFAYAAPTGYPENSSRWVSPGALIERLNFALALTAHNVVDVRLQPDRLLNGVDADQPSAVLDQLSQQILHGDVSATTRRILEKNALPAEGESKTVDVGRLTALILGSPEFQRR